MTDDQAMPLPPDPYQATELLDEWGQWLKRTLIRDWSQERAEIVYHAFCTAWVNGIAQGAATERERFAGIPAHFRDEAAACKALAEAHDEAADTRGGRGTYEIGCEMAFLEAARYVADLLDGTP